PKILWYARRIHRCRIPLLGTLKEYRGAGVDAMMYHWIWTKGALHGYYWGEGGGSSKTTPRWSTAPYSSASAPTRRTGSTTNRCEGVRHRRHGIRRCAPRAGAARPRRPGDVPRPQPREGARPRLERRAPGAGRLGRRRRAARRVRGRRADLPRGGAHQRPRYGRVHARQPRRDGERARSRGARTPGTLRARLLARRRRSDRAGEADR